MTICLAQLTMDMGGRRLFAGATLTLSGKKRIGIVGHNGSGKSTLLRLICGELEPAAGSVTVAKGYTLGWMRQEQYHHDAESIRDVVLKGRPALWKAFEHKNRLLETDPWTDAVGYELADAESEIERLDGYTAEAQAERLLSGLGIDRHDAHMGELSGGYRLRVLLAQSLFSNPDILLLDEPTNYLDILAVQWLENFLLTEFEGLLLFVSHDRCFLSALATHILDIDYADIRLYPGGYDAFIAAKTGAVAQASCQRAHIEQRIAKMQAFIERFRSTPTRARQAMSRQKQVDKIELPQIEQSHRRAPSLHFKPERPSGARVLKIKGLSKAYERPIFADLNLEIERGQKLGFIGKNGVGKSTLLKLIVGAQPPDEGTVEWGHAVRVGYFSQNHHDLLTGDGTVFQWLAQAAPRTPDLHLKRTLGQCLFEEADRNKKLPMLSGGESARLLLARLMLQHPNVLVLDEPTNHLDLEAIGALADALETFVGTVLVVSHDRDFLSRATDSLLLIDDGQLHTQGDCNE